MVWMLNLYSAERTNFVNHESPLIDETIFKMSKNLFQIQDTARFQNNWQENSITITWGVKDTTVEMGRIVNQSYVYGRLSYDLRDSSWCLDSLVHYYKKSDLPFPIFFIRKDANGKIIDRYPSEDPNIFLPAIFRMPWYVEGHRLEVKLAYPGYSLWPPTKFGYYLPCYRSYCRDGLPIYWWRSIAVRKHWSICNGMKYNISFGNYKYSSVIYMAQNRITPPRLSLYPHRSMSNCYTKISNNTKIWSLK